MFSCAQRTTFGTDFAAAAPRGERLDDRRMVGAEIAEQVLDADIDEAFHEIIGSRVGLSIGTGVHNGLLSRRHELPSLRRSRGPDDETVHGADPCLAFVFKFAMKLHVTAAPLLVLCRDRRLDAHRFARAQRALHLVVLRRQDAARRQPRILAQGAAGDAEQDDQRGIA